MNDGFNVFYLARIIPYIEEKLAGQIRSCIQYVTKHIKF